MPTPSTSDDADEAMSDFEEGQEEVEVTKKGKANGAKASKRQCEGEENQLC